VLANLRQRARSIKRDTLTLYLVARHPATPWYAKALALLIAGYALSPIDLIPDFIPVLGYVDDVILLPAAIVLCVRLVSPAVLAECRQQAAALAGKPVSRAAGAIIVVIWLLLAVAFAAWGWRVWQSML
jgi:uncharacterized membrane protein YkvA (DUF1232 family)